MGKKSECERFGYSGMEKIKNILCVTDKKGWCLYNIMNTLKEYMPQYDIDVISLKDKFKPNKYDLVYYTHFSLYKKRPCNKNKITTVTSHKCLNDMKKTLKLLNKFDGVSVNSMILYDIFKDHIENLAYTPSGVDIKNFNFKNNTRNDKLVLGWVGNRDRSVKNYDTIFKPLKKSIFGVKFKEIATRKRDTHKDFLDAKGMAKFYHQLDFFVITSDAEGTPNPGLEAMSCGVPIISTRVGNMVEIVDDGVDGFFCDNNLKSFIKCINNVKDISQNDYYQMSHNIRIKMAEWDWSIIYKKYEYFFESVI